MLFNFLIFIIHLLISLESESKYHTHTQNSHHDLVEYHMNRMRDPYQLYNPSIFKDTCLEKTWNDSLVNVPNVRDASANQENMEKT